MAFGLLKHFKEAKKSTINLDRETHYKHIIIGHDLGAVLKLMELKKTHPDESIRLISSRMVTRLSLQENYEFGVSQLRSADAVQNIYKKFFNLKLDSQKEDAAFYKDGKFHDFGGRAKSMNMLTGEEFFVQKGYRIHLSGLFSQEDWENLDTILGEFLEIRHFDSIEKTTPEDLVQKAEWKLHFKDFATTTCECLYVSESPKKFLNYLNHKEQLTPELIDVCSSINIQSGISVTWILNKELYQSERTLFIPQSMTHEWGHFILEFEAFDYEKKQQVCHALFLIHEDEPQTEDLASKIKLMKRVIDRVFPHFDEVIMKEYIRFDHEMLISDIKDNLSQELTFDYPTLKFIGQTSAMISDFSKEKFMARTLLH